MCLIFQKTADRMNEHTLFHKGSGADRVFLHPALTHEGLMCVWGGGGTGREGVRGERDSEPEKGGGGGGVSGRESEIKINSSIKLKQQKTSLLQCWWRELVGKPSSPTLLTKAITYLA